MGDRLRSVIAWLRERSAWLVAACFGIWAGPWVAGWFGLDFRLTWLVLLLTISLPSAVLASLLAPPPDRRRRRLDLGLCAWVALSAGSWAVAEFVSVWTVEEHLTSWSTPQWLSSRILWLHFQLEAQPFHVWFAVLLVGVVLVDTHRRANLSGAQVVRRLAVTAGALAILGAIEASLGAGTSWACFSPPAPATGAPCGVADPLGGRIMLHGLALLVVATGMRRSRGDPTLVALALWFATKIALDVAARSAADATCEDPGRAASELTQLAGWSTAVEHIGAGLVMGWLTWAMLRAALRRDGLVAWPVLPVMILASSHVFDPPLSTGFSHDLRRSGARLASSLSAGTAREIAYPSWRLATPDARRSCSKRAVRCTPSETGIIVCSSRARS